MKELKSSRLLKILLIVYGVVYVAMMAETLYPIEEMNSELIGVIISLTLYIVGVVAAWFNKKIAAVILMCQYILVWVFAFTIWTQAGLALVLTLPILIMAAFLYRNWYAENTEKYRTNPNARLLLLDTLLLNYSVLYLFVVVYSVMQRYTDLAFFKDNALQELYARIDYFSLTGLLLGVAILIYIVGLIILRKRRLMSGFMFVLWYLIVVILTLTDQSFSQTGPWFMFGIVILINGVLYIKDSIFLEKLANQE